MTVRAAMRVSILATAWATLYAVGTARSYHAPANEGQVMSRSMRQQQHVMAHASPIRPAVAADDFIYVDGLHFKDSKGAVFFAQGINFWSCMNLAADDEVGGDLKRLQTELDRLQDVGVNVLRIMGATEGASSWQPFRLYPALQPGPGRWDERMFVGLDRCIAEAGRRGMRLIMVMGNTWQWSGGIAQLHAWSQGNSTIPYPRAWDIKAHPQRNDGHAGWGNWVQPTPDDSINDFMSFQADFYADGQARALYKGHLDRVMGRTNSITGRTYSNDPTILAWEPVNEPQTSEAIGKTTEPDPMIDWHHEVSSFIKSKAPKQLSTTGFEAKQGEKRFKQLHDSKAIDFACAHLWTEIWGHYDMLDPLTISLSKAKNFASGYLADAERWAREIGKPIVLEEFGMARDNWQNMAGPYLYDTKASTTHRDMYFSYLFDLVWTGFTQNAGFAGLLPWSFGGQFRSATQQANAQGMLYAGDPPQEPPGWFSILDTDSTMTLMKSWHDRIVAQSQP